MIQVIAFLALLFVSQVACAQNEIKVPVYVRNVQIPDLQQDEVVAVQLPKDLYRKVSDFDSMVRLFDGEGAPIPFVLRTRVEKKESEQDHTWAAEDLQVLPSEEDELVYSFSIKPHTPRVDHLIFQTDLKNFEQSIKIIAFDQDGTEHEIVSDGLIFDRSRYLDYRNLKVKFEPTTAKSFRVTIGVATLEQKSVLQRMVERTQDGEVTERTIESASLKTSFHLNGILVGNYEKHFQIDRNVLVEYEDFQSKKILEDDSLVLEIPCDGATVSQVRFDIKDRLFQRAVSIAGLKRAETAYQAVSQDRNSIHRFQFRDDVDEQVEINFPPQRYQTLKITIPHRQSTPIDVEGVTLAGPGYDLVFVGHPGEKYQLRYGENLKSPKNTDAQEFLRRLEKQEPELTALLEEEEIVPVASLPAPPLTFDDLVKNPWIFGSVVLALVVLLFRVLITTARKLQSESGDGQQF